MLQPGMHNDVHINPQFLHYSGPVTEIQDFLCKFDIGSPKHLIITLIGIDSFNIHFTKVGACVETFCFFVSSF